MTERKKNKYVMVVVDRSGSMKGKPLASVEQAAKKFITRYYELEQSTKNLIAILFDAFAKVVETPIITDFLKEFETECVSANRTTFFKAPLNEISKQVQRKGMKELHVIFLTDGKDRDHAGTN